MLHWAVGCGGRRAEVANERSVPAPRPPAIIEPAGLHGANKPSRDHIALKLKRVEKRRVLFACLACRIPGPLGHVGPACLPKTSHGLNLEVLLAVASGGSLVHHCSLPVSLPSLDALALMMQLLGLAQRAFRGGGLLQG